MDSHAATQNIFYREIQNRKFHTRFLAVHVHVRKYTRYHLQNETHTRERYDSEIFKFEHDNRIAYIEDKHTFCAPKTNMRAENKYSS